MRSRTVAFVVMFVVLGSVAPAAEARPDPLVCGQLVATSVVLHSDLSCSGDGLVVVASNVTVRLDGHTITSTSGTGFGVRLGETSRGSTAGCYDGVEVRGGTITGFFAGIGGTGTCWPARAGRVTGTTLAGNTWGVAVPYRTRLSIERTTIVGPNGIGGPGGFQQSLTGNVDLHGSRVQVTSPNGFSAQVSNGSTSTIDSSQLHGGHIYNNASGRFTISNSRLTDVTVDCNDSDVAISNSRLTGRTTVVGATCGYSLVDDRFVGPGAGAAVVFNGASYSIVITGSTFTGWDTAVEIANAGATITGNTFRNNGVGVVSCRSGCRGTVSENSFVDNTGTGLLLIGGIWNVGSNTALRNGGLGIDAEGPLLFLTDDGGNVARGNLEPQCIGVVCAPHA